MPGHDWRVMLKRLLAFTSLCLPLLLPGQAHADIRFDRISVEDGLSQSSVFALSQDSRGFLWMATERAADRYDGYGFSAFRHRPGEPDSISDNTARAFFTDRDAGLWIGTDNGINRYDPDSGRLQRFFPASGTGDGRLQVLEQGIVEDCGGDILFLARDGLWVIASGHGHPEPTVLEGRAEDRFRGSILTDRNGGVWVADGRHLWFRPCGAEKFRKVFRLPDSTVRAMAGPNALALAPEGSVLWASGDGLRRFDPDRGLMLSVDHPSSHGLSRDEIDAIAVDDRGDFWLALPGQIVRVRTSGKPQWRVMTEFDALSLESRGLQRLQVGTSGDGLTWVAGHFGVGVQAESADRLQLLHNDPRDPQSLPLTFGRAGYVMHIDDFGVVWIGANLAGLARYVPEKHRFENVRDLEPGADNIIRGVAEQQVDGQTWVWTGSAQSGLRLWRRGAEGNCGLQDRIRVGGELSATPTDRIAALARNPRDGRVWALGRHWAAQLDVAGPDVREVAFASPGPRSNLRAMAFSQSGDRLYVSEARRIWFVETAQAAATRLFRPLPVEGGRAPEGIFALAATREGRLVAGGRGGLLLVDPESGRSRHFLPGGPETLSPANFVFSLLEQPQGTLWIGTRGGGLARVELSALDDGEPVFEWWTRESGLVDDTIYAILPDPSGRLWLSSNRGLTRFDPASGQMRHYGKQDGLHQYEFNGRVADIGPSGQFYFGGIDGFNVFRPEDIADHPEPPTIHLQSVSVNGTELEPGAVSNRARALQLDHADNYLVFDYVGLHYVASDEIRYAYRLDGLESEWVDAGNQRQARYPALPPGDYRFQVRAANSDGVWSQPRDLAALTVRSPPWLQPLAWIVYVFAIALALAVVAALVLRRRRILEAMIADRTRELAERNQTISQQSRQLEEALEARTTLFANVSHEFRTPLTLVEASLVKLAGQAGTEDAAITQGRRYLRRLQRLVEQLLDLSRMRVKKGKAFGEPWHMTPVVNHTVEAFRTLAEQRGIGLRSSLESGWTTTCRQEFVEKVLLNLLNNAIKYTGSVVVVTLAGKDDGVVLEVADDGPGIPPEEQELIFERFRRRQVSESGSSRGAGIGLALVREAIGAMNGRLELESDQNRGSRFRMYLSATRTRDAGTVAELVDRDRLLLETESLTPLERPGREPARRSPDRPEGTVLVVEDNPDLCRYLVDMLADRWRTISAGNGREGLEAARSGNPDLIVSDIMMPDMDGLQMLEALRADIRTSHMPVLLLTARQDAETRLKGLELSADDFLAKPFDGAELQLRLKRMIDNRRRLRERLLQDIASSPDADVESLDGEVEGRAGAPALSRRDRELLGQLDQWLESCHADASSSIEELCRTLNVEARTLQRKTRALLGMTPVECLRSYRLDKAAALLRDTDRTITEIALSCGFSSPQYFTRQFRHHYGQTPSDWRTGAGRHGRSGIERST